MPVFRLSPVDLLDPNWEASSHRGPAIVRARDESAARALAEKAFAVKTGFPPGHGIRVPPWTRPQLVKVERIDDPRWEGDDSDGVLDPSFEQDLNRAGRRT